MSQTPPQMPSEMPAEPAPSAGRDIPVAFQDRAYLDAVLDLLGAIAYGEFSAFERLAEDAKMAPALEDKVEIAGMAARELGHFMCLRERITDLGGDAFQAMKPFHVPIEAFHRHTAPRDWLEGLVKAFVGDGLANDFYREIAAFVDAGTREVIVESLDDDGQSDFIVDRVRRAIEQDPRVGGRLALWGRRLMGEALSQAQRVAAERDALAALLSGGVDRPGMDLAAIGRMFARLTENHQARMERLGLSA